MRLPFVAVCSLMLLSLALATPETHQVGPFKISFDVKTDMKYDIQTPNPQSNSLSTVYPLFMHTDNMTGASIVITEYRRPVDSTQQMQGALSFWIMKGDKGLNATLPLNQTIDGKSGFLLSGVPYPGSKLPAGFKLYQAQYWLDSKECSECGLVSAGTTRVDITSTYPHDVTMNLLDSIKVAKSG